MTTFEPCSPEIVSHSDDPHLAYDNPTVDAQADIATLIPSFSQGRPAPPECRDPFACYKSFQDSIDAASGRSENDVPCNRDGRCCHSPCSDAQGACFHAEQTDTRERASQCSIEVRFANRPNGLPLATIIERNSYSTLHSRGSLLSVNYRFPPNQASNASSAPHSHRASRNLEETTLHMIQEHANHEQDVDDMIDDQASLHVGPVMPCSEYRPTVPITPHSQHGQLSETAKLQDADNDSEGKGLKRLLRGVIQHVRSASRRSESRSSFLASSSPDRPGKHKNTTNDLESQGEEDSEEPLIGDQDRPTSCTPAYTDYPQLPHCDAAETWAEDCERSLSDPETSARDIPTIRHVPPDKSGPSDEQSRPDGCQSTSHLQPTVSTEGPERATSRDGVHSFTMSGMPLVSTRTRDDDAVRYTFDGVPLYRATAPSLYEHDRTRNASFCSTTSTTYSSTVLGIDLDLHHGYPPNSRRSSTPAWFGASGPDLSRENIDIALPNPSSDEPRSITSSALPLLLPLAAASGIVQTNNTMSLSFYSPNGNLIQAQRSTSSLSGSQAYYQNTLSFSEPSARPAAVPLTTPPHSSMPLPSYLKQKQQHHRHTRSDIVPQSVMTNNQVKGCNGIVRTNSLTPRSGVRRSTAIRKPRPLSADTFRSRFRPVASCTPSQMRTRAKISKPKPPTTANKRPKASSELRKRWSSGHTPRKTGAGVGPLAGWTFRVCFCQPWDEPTGDVEHPTAGDAIGSLGEASHDHAHGPAPDLVAHVPARIVHATARK